MNQPDYAKLLLPGIREGDTRDIVRLFKILCAHLCVTEGRAFIEVSREFLDDNVSDQIEIRWTPDYDKESYQLQFIDHRGRRNYDEVEVEIVTEQDKTFPFKKPAQLLIPKVTGE